MSYGKAQVFDMKGLGNVQETYFSFELDSNNVVTKAILLKPNAPVTLTNLTFEASMGHLNTESLPQPDYVRIQSALLYKLDGEPEAQLRDAFLGSPVPVKGPGVIDFTDAQAPMTTVGGILNNFINGRTFQTQTCQLKGVEDIQNACVLDYTTQYRDTFTWKGQLHLDRNAEIYMLVKYQLSNPASSYDGITVGGKLQYTTAQLY